MSDATHRRRMPAEICRLQPRTPAAVRPILRRRTARRPAASVQYERDRDARVPAQSGKHRWRWPSVRSIEPYAGAAHLGRTPPRVPAARMARRATGARRQPAILARRSLRRRRARRAERTRRSPLTRHGRPASATVSGVARSVASAIRQYVTGSRGIESAALTCVGERVCRRRALRPRAPAGLIPIAFRLHRRIA